MRQVLDFVYASVGKQAAIVTLGVAFAIIFAVILWWARGLKITINRKLLLLIVVVLGLYWSWSFKIVAERIHILEYGLLGYWIARDLLKGRINIVAGTLTILVLCAFAFLDEGFQYFLPYRVFDLRDIVFNLAGGAWGACLFLIKKQHCSVELYP